MGRFNQTKSVGIAVALLGLLSPISKAAFVAGDIYVGNDDGDIWNISGGGNFSSIAKFADIGGTPDYGKSAFSADNSTMYVSRASQGNVYAITSTGTVSLFASGLSGPSGVLRTSTGKILVVEMSSGEVTDITAGGDFTSALPFAQGLSTPCDIAQTIDGRIFVSERISSEVSNITAGGTIGSAQVFASGIGAVPLGLVADSNGGLMVTAASTAQIYAINSTGVKSLFASGRQLFSLAFTADNNLLATDITFDSVFNITAGGNTNISPVHANGFSRNLHTLTVVPPALPEPASVSLLTIAGFTLISRRRRSN